MNNSDFEIRRLSTVTPDFSAVLDGLLAWDSEVDGGIQQAVLKIIAAVRARGDTAVLEFTTQFDRFEAPDMASLRFERKDLQAAWERTPAVLTQALQSAADRIRRHAEHQKLQSWHYEEADGTVLGQQVSPLDRVGLYVPGGKAAYPSSVLMNAIPAKVAGVPEVVMVVPTPGGERNDLVLAAAYVAGVDYGYCIGGAQAVAALAYGTESLARVDKIVGPGNIFVATAKRLVFGEVGIDMVAGPSEILVLSDGSASPEWLAMDLFSQAEHDEDAQAILLSPEADHLDAVAQAMRKLLPTLERASVIVESMNRRGALIHVRDLDEAVQLANRIAPEHLELAVQQPDVWLPKIRHAGAIFMGAYSPEALGDYCAGPNHVLPTSGTARFSSPLGVYDFQKRSSIIHCSAQSAQALGGVAQTLARGEGLTAHARSAGYRV